jgi:hypothetical protein
MLRALIEAPLSKYNNLRIPTRWEILDIMHHNHVVYRYFKIKEPKVKRLDV